MESYAVPSLSSVKPASKCPCDESVYESVFANSSKGSPCQETQGQIVKVLDGVYYIDSIFSQTECSKLCNEIVKSNELSFWSDKGRNDTDAKSFRDADTIEVTSDNIANVIWNRIKAKLQSLDLSLKFESSDNRDDDSWHVDLPGTWNPVNINNDLLFAKYSSLGYFSPHTDGNAIQNFNLRSFYSVIIFLNDIPEGCGGGTKFYTKDAANKLYQKSPGTAWLADSSLCLGEVHAKAGRFLFFEQSLVHEGVSPEIPYEKFIIRTDIMFQRSPLLLTQSSDEEAYRLHREAEVLAEAGDIKKSIELFRKAFKMSPDLARLMGQA